MAIKQHITSERIPSSTYVPPPSPIPTALGSRSATDSRTSELIEKLKKVPELILPRRAHHLSSVSISSAPLHPSSRPDGNIIDYQWLRLKDYDAVNQVLRSATEIGTFMIYDHGIPTLDLQKISSLLEEANMSLFGELSSNQCFWSSVHLHHQAHVRNVMGLENFRIFSQKIENAIGKLEGISKDLVEVLFIDQSSDRTIGSSSIILHKHYEFFDDSHQDYHYDHVQLRQENSDTFALSLLLPLPPQNDDSMTSDTVFVTIGEQLKESNLMANKNSTKTVEGMPNLKWTLSSSGQQSSFSIEMRCSLSDISNLRQPNIRMISLTDQLLFVLILMLLFNVLVSYSNELMK